MPKAPALTDSMERAAADALADALARAPVLHLPGVRERHRRLLERAIALAGAALAGARQGQQAAASARATLLEAHAARAQDARHGAGQMSLASQRAPTADACEDGWQRVEEIVSVVEESAREAARIAAQLGAPAAWKTARAAGAEAREARRIVAERNRAYTFHTDPSFSFGEGWYLAAAALLAGVEIQVEPARAQTAQALRFLKDAGLEPNLRPFRSRPPANKPLPEIVARAFRADPRAAQRKVRAGFLGDGPVPPAIVDWAARALAGAPAGKKVLVWVRYSPKHDPARNSTHAELVDLCRLALVTGLVPVLIGDALRDGPVPPGAFDLTLFWKLPLFQGADMRRAQLQLVEQLRAAHGLVGQLGVTTAGMDGPALLGLPTLYLTQSPNVRLGLWVGAVPGYEEVVRDGGYLERIALTLKRWTDLPDLDRRPRASAPT